MLGPVKTLHKPNGELASDTAFWYDDDYVEPIRALNIKRDWSRLKSFEKKIRSKLSKHSYKQEVEDSVGRYVRGLDSPDWNSSFIKLWGLLEALTATSPKDSHEVSVKRVLFVQRDRHYQKQVLTHLRNNRNASIHSGQEAEEIETILYQLKNYVEALLRFHIGNIYKFNSIEDSAEFMDLPPEVPDLEKEIETLEARIALVKNAVKFDSL